MSSYLLTWNPKKSPWPEITQYARDVRQNKFVTQRWSLGVRKNVVVGESVYWVRVGDEPKGVFARGVIRSEPFEAEHWDEERAAKGDKTTYAFIQITDLRVPGQERIIDSQVIERHEALAAQNWTPESSGTKIDEEAAALLEASFDELIREGSPPSYQELSLLSRYSREDVAGTFEPDYQFNPNAGRWSPLGIVSPEGSADTVFFVTLGQSQGEHTFVEGISEEGILVWQSQPNQKLSHPSIRRLIEHDEKAYNIFLFLRASGKDDYSYCGRLAYDSHINDLEQPVHFTWRLLDWPEIQNGIFESIGMSPLETEAVDEEQRSLQTDPSDTAPVVTAKGRPGLTRTDPPAPKTRSGTTRRNFTARPSSDRAKQDASNRKLGSEGEKAVLALEIERLIAAGRRDLADRVSHKSEVEGDGLGYDILSFDENGNKRHIEVKTTRGGEDTQFFISENEVCFSRLNPKTFILVRVYDFRPEIGSGQFYELKGDVERHFRLKPKLYTAERA